MISCLEVMPDDKYTYLMFNSSQPRDATWWHKSRSDVAESLLETMFANHDDLKIPISKTRFFHLVLLIGIFKSSWLANSILKSHPDIYGTKELSDMEDCSPDIYTDDLCMFCRTVHDNSGRPYDSVYSSYCAGPTNG